MLYTRSSDLVRTRSEVEEMGRMQNGFHTSGGPGIAMPVARLRIALIGAFLDGRSVPISLAKLVRQPDT